MTSMLHRLLPLLAAACIIAGCGSNNPTGPDNSGPIMPLKVGNLWVLKGVSLDSLGTPGRTTLDSVQITGTKNVEGETWYTTGESVMMALRSNGFWMWNKDLDDVPRLFVPYPATLNALTVQDTLNGSDTIISCITATSTNETVTTPTGTYRCIRYETRYRSTDGKPYQNARRFDGEKIIYMAPNVGVVRQDEFRKTTEGKVYQSYQWELVAIELK